MQDRFWVGLAAICGLVLALGEAKAETGLASYYSLGARTASGERFRPDASTCAHRTIAFNTIVRVTDLATGRSVSCRVTDRGPFVRGRVIDLSRGVARALGILGRGIAKVSVTR